MAYLKVYARYTCLIAVGLIWGTIYGQNIEAPPEYTKIVDRVEDVILDQMDQKKLDAVSIALVADKKVIWSHGFGHEDKARTKAASGESVYRIASLSKLFTAMAVMQQAELENMDIDAPISTYLPDFAPKSSFDKPITLRQLMAHRSGLVREPPVGHYFDPEELGLAALVESLNETELVYEPEARTKYSNAAVSVAGHAVAEMAGKQFEAHMQEALLNPIGMENSSFDSKSDVAGRLAHGYMWTYAGKKFDAPTFELGMIPAAGMYATVNDLGKFIQGLVHGGWSGNGKVLSAETLNQMWQVQYNESNLNYGFGLGFFVNRFEGHLQVRHGGVMYGYATQIAALPEQGIGAVTIITNDCANSVADRINAYAMQLLLKKKNNHELHEFARTTTPSNADFYRFIGRYESENKSVEISNRKGELIFDDNSERNRLRATDDGLIVDDILSHGTTLKFIDKKRILVNKDTLIRTVADKPGMLSNSRRGLIGEYGWDHNVLYILEREDQLYALIEWFFFYPLTQKSENVFSFPDYGLYHGEDLIFERDASGRAISVNAASIHWDRRNIEPTAGNVFKIDPVRPVDELRPIARNASPPDERRKFKDPDLVELRSLDPTIKYDIRYASTNNFMGARFYKEQHAFLQRKAAEAVVRASEKLATLGYGLLIHDAYRPWFVTKMFWDATPSDLKIFVANPADGSRHNRGAAVDLTLYDLESGEPVDMVSGYDEFSDRSYADYPGGTARQRWHRELLRTVMESEGFSVYSAEWWHFDYQGWRDYPILNQTFEELQ